MTQDFSGQNLQGRSFKGENLRGANFSHAEITGANFSHACLSDANFSHTEIAGANFSHASLSDANFSHAQIAGVDFSYACLTDADFSHAELRGVSFSHACLTDVNYSQASILGYDFSDTCLADANLNNTENKMKLAKLVVLKVGNGDFDTGFPVMLQISDEKSRIISSTTGILPPAPDIPELYSQWQTLYINYAKVSLARIKVGKIYNLEKNFSLDELYDLALNLEERINDWLSYRDFLPLRDILLRTLAIDEDEIRIFIQTENTQLMRLPWHNWEVLAIYPHAEIAFSLPNYRFNQKNYTRNRSRVRILAIFGNSSGINIDADRKLLNDLIPEAEMHYIVEPSREKLNEFIWEIQDINIIYFAGHGSRGYEKDLFDINSSESLSIKDLSYALRKAIEGNLQLAIFNSCDGLAIAKELASWHLPQIIVMRELVPDVVAQEFLKHFLRAFAGGKSLYLAFREARERLQGLENKFPCASWLPVLFQNPAEDPPTWQDLCGM